MATDITIKLFTIVYLLMKLNIIAILRKFNTFLDALQKK